MENKIRAIFINSEKQEISEIKIENKLDTYYDLIKCDTIEACCQDLISDRSFIYVDEEGLFTKDKFFTVKGAYQTYAGNGVLLCIDDDGNEVDINISISEARAKIIFV